MKQLILLSAMLTTVVIGNAQKTLPANRMPVNNRPLTANPALATLVSQARKTTYAGTFNPAPIVRNIGGVNVRSTAVVNGTNTDNITTNRPAANPAQTTVENGFECTTSRETVTADSKSFMSVTANGDGIYPGAIYTFNDFMNGNFLREVGVGKRNPIQIFTNNLANSSGNASVTVANPNSANIMNSIASLVRNNSVSNVSATQIGQYIYSQNQASLMMNISGGGAYSGFSASASFNMNKQSNHIYVTCDFKIPLYTLYTNFPETGFLSDQNLERTPNLIILNSVTYGTRVLVNIDIDESSLDVKTAAKFKYGDPNSAGFNVDLGFLLSNSSIRTTVNTYIVGANPQNLGNPTSLAQIYSFVDACIRNTNYQTAKPIGYTMSSMAGELIGIRSATDEYMVKNCVPKQSTVYLADATITISTKGNYKENGSNASFKLYAANGASMIASAVNNNGQMGPNGDNTVGLTMNGQVLKSSLSLGKNFLDIVLDNPNCAFTCDDWEIDNVFLTLNFKDEKGTPLERKFFSICSTPFVIQKGKLLRLEFDGNFRALTQNLY